MSTSVAPERPDGQTLYCACWIVLAANSVFTPNQPATRALRKVVRTAYCGR